MRSRCRFAAGVVLALVASLSAWSVRAGEMEECIAALRAHIATDDTIDTALLLSAHEILGVESSAPQSVINSKLQLTEESLFTAYDVAVEQRNYGQMEAIRYAWNNFETVRVFLGNREARFRLTRWLEARAEAAQRVNYRQTPELPDLYDILARKRQIPRELQRVPSGSAAKVANSPLPPRALVGPSQAELERMLEENLKRFPPAKRGYTTTPETPEERRARHLSYIKTAGFAVSVGTGFVILKLLGF